MNFRWFLSSTVRDASHMHKHVWKLVNAQRDILTVDAIRNVQKAMDELDAAMRSDSDTAALKARMEALEVAANKWLKPYPNAGLRENVEVLLVAIAVAMAIRTFIAQPFKIPTGSMQPTLFGITSTPDYTSRFPESQTEADFTIPNPVVRFLKFWYTGVSYTQIKARRDSHIYNMDEPKRFLLFNLYQRFWMQTPSGELDAYSLWFPSENIFARAGLASPFGGLNPRVFKAGEDIMKIKVISGDHLFVDRVTYNFRRPTLGEIIVFETRGIPRLPQDQFYIKRMVAMGNNKVQLGNDRHLRIDGKRLDTNTAHFENVYSFPADRPPMDSVYS